MIKLNVTNRKTKAQKSYQLSQNTIMLGRQSDCDVVLEAHGVSRQHAKISLNRNLLEIEDLASGNGTIINQTKLKPKEKTPIKNGDKIRIEEFEIEIVSQEAAKFIPPPPSATLPPKPMEKPVQPEKTKSESPKDKPDLEKEPTASEQEFKESKFDITDPDIIEIKMIKKVLGALDPDKMPSLTVTGEPFAGKKVIFEEGQEELTIGRDEDCDLSLNDSVISRRHATLCIKWGGYVLTDLDSKNNTFVNGHKIKETTLKDGDEVVFGTIKAIFKNPQEFDIGSIAETLKEPPPVSDAAKLSTNTMEPKKETEAKKNKKTEDKKDTQKDQETKEKDAEKNKDDADGILSNIDKDEQKKSLPPPPKPLVQKTSKGLSVLEILMMVFGVCIVGIVIASLWYLLR